MVADVCELARVADREADGDESVKKGEGEEEEEEGVEAHVVVANPPYISDRGFGRDTARSARCWEPRAALVPDPSGSVSGPEAEAGKESVGEESGDVLYGDILGLAIRRFARIVVMEVADGDQAVRVLRIARAAAERRGKSGWWERAQIWHDNLDAWRAAEEDELGKVEELRNALGIEVERIGTGTARAVVLAREWGTTVLDEPRP
ncbi:MAG: hypothetical protein LQ340_007324 [Diploschistes diacapsis]|nr:MAG: hypothetical protein LQ340_007324 [Diploschistes diacapsis]